MNQRSIGYIGAVALAIAPMLAAQQPPPPERQTPPEESSVRVENRTVEGEVVEVNAQRLVVRTSDGNRMTFAVDRDLTSGSTPIAVGQRVRVDYRSGVDPLAVVTVSRIPGTGSMTEAVKDTAEDVADAVEDAADEVEDAFDPDDNDRREPARVAPAPSATARVQDPAATRAQDPARAPTAATRAQDPAQDDELPDTASPLPALVLAGLALLGSGFGLSARRRE